MVDLNYKVGDYIKFRIFGDLIIGRITVIGINSWDYIILYRERSDSYPYAGYPNRYIYTLSRTFAIKYQVTIITQEEAFMEIL